MLTNFKAMKRTSTLILLILMFMLVSCHSPQKLFYSELAEIQSSGRTDFAQITEAGIEHLPEPVQRYLHHCGFAGTPVANHAEIIWEDSHIRMKPDQKWMRLKTYQQNFVGEPSRLVYMRANMLGFIPFEGRDKYNNGKGHMFGTLGRLIKVFDAHDEETAKGAAIVVLAEALLVPSYAIQPYIHWEEVDELTARARFIHKGMDVGGTFHFNDRGEYIRFTTHERPFSSPNGGYEEQPYTIEIRNYQQQGDRIIAREVSAIWNLPDGDFEYWKGTLREIRFY
jgi:hypothetical protein